MRQSRPGVKDIWVYHCINQHRQLDPYLLREDRLVKIGIVTRLVSGELRIAWEEVLRKYVYFLQDQGFSGAQQETEVSMKINNIDLGEDSILASALQSIS